VGESQSTNSTDYAAKARDDEGYSKRLPDPTTFDCR
jgi:hypothetical protein